MSISKKVTRTARERENCLVRTPLMARSSTAKTTSNRLFYYSPIYHKCYNKFT